MKKYLSIISSMLLLVNFLGCGDNKTKEKLIGTQIIDANSPLSASPGQYSSSLAANSATMVTKMGQGTGALHAPALLSSVVYRALPPGMSGPDGENFYSSSQQGSIIRIKFMDAGSAPLTFDQVKLGQMRKLNVRITSQYSYGEWNGDFYLDKQNPYGQTDPEILTKGTITASDPVGGTFTATLAAGMTFDYVTLSDNTKIGIPNNGSMTLTSSGGYTSTMNYSKSGTDYTCTGDIVLTDGTVVAKVYLTFSKTFINYTGYYLDKDGVRHEISPR